MESIVKKLQEGLAVQDSSSTLMTFLVQDLLDYAHIKSNKFKPNIKPLNVVEMVDKVMGIQKDKAEAQGLDFSSEFVNIASEGEEVEHGRRSPVVYCDE